jgi:hypothetical protein
MATVDRYEINRQIRGILIRHDVDLTKIDYSFIGNTAYLYGELAKNYRKDDFELSGIEQMIRELSRIPGVRYLQVDLKNWIISHSGHSVNIMKGKSAPAPQTIATGNVEGQGMDVELKDEKEEKTKDFPKRKDEKKDP